MMWHGYMAVESLALNAVQRSTLVTALKALGPASALSPARLNHWRTRLDNEAIILEALFDQANLTVEKFKQRLGVIFGISWVTIGHRTQETSFAGGQTTIVTFRRTGADYLRFALFGGAGASWQESGDECRGYLALNAAEWETEEEE